MVNNILSYIWTLDSWFKKTKDIVIYTKTLKHEYCMYKHAVEDANAQN